MKVRQIIRGSEKHKENLKCLDCGGVHGFDDYIIPTSSQIRYSQMTVKNYNKSGKSNR
jgi:hypothetical protein